MSAEKTFFVSENFTESERSLLSHFFSNVDSPVFVLQNLPETVKGAMFARYSRTHKSLRRLFLDEFADDVTSYLPAENGGTGRAERLYHKIFVGYGDDSVAQLGGAHVGCEQISNIACKEIERGRLMSYLEKSTRYLDFSKKHQGRYNYLRPLEIVEAGLLAEYEKTMDLLFDTYSSLQTSMSCFYKQQFPKTANIPEKVYNQSLKAKVYDTLRGLLPASAVTNMGIYANGQSYEYLIMRLRASPLAEVRSYAELMLVELRKTIPSFLERVDLEDRGAAWTKYLGETSENMKKFIAGEVFMPGNVINVEAPSVLLTDFDEDAENKMLAYALFSFSDIPEHEAYQHVGRMSAEQKMKMGRTYAGDRLNRRHKPGRALEIPVYRFEVVCDYGAFRDLQRHRLVTLEWQTLGTGLGWNVPEYVKEAGCLDRYTEAMEAAAQLCATVTCKTGVEAASYCVPLGYNVRFSMQLNAREAIHICELRTMKTAHPSYKQVATEMHRHIKETANHKIVAELMRFVGKADDKGLERLDETAKFSADQISMPSI